VGEVSIDPSRREITGRNPERQDSILGPFDAPSFAGYFCARFDQPFDSFGTAQGSTIHEGVLERTDSVVSAYVRFGSTTHQVNVRIGVSFISLEQARLNLDSEIPDGTTLEDTAFKTRSAWAEKLDRVKIEGATEEQKTIFYTGFFHTLQYPYEQSESGRYYSGYDDKVSRSYCAGVFCLPIIACKKIHDGESYTGYSIWDTFVRLENGCAIATLTSLRAACTKCLAYSICA
jgi:putative alpha-1,2-mannosidase